MQKPQEKYLKQQYPHYLPSEKLVWVLKPGDVLEQKDNQYIVKQVLKSNRYSAMPKIYLEEICQNQ